MEGSTRNMVERETENRRKYKEYGREGNRKWKKVQGRVERQ
jgi:hypothetical protein